MDKYEYHPEDYCQKCERRMRFNYSADSIVWNKVMRAPDGKEESEIYSIVCIECFLKECESAMVIAKFSYFHGKQFESIDVRY